MSVTAAYKHRETTEYRTPQGGASSITVGLTDRDTIHFIVSRTGRGSMEMFFTEKQAQSISDMILRALAQLATG